jgi:sortase (surface protein transpeptidase)
MARHTRTAPHIRTARHKWRARHARSALHARMARWPRRLALDALTVLLAGSGVFLVAVGGGPPPGQPDRASDARPGFTGAPAPPGPPAPRAMSPTAPSGGAPAGPGATARGTTEPAPLGRSVPVHLDIPTIGVSTPLMALGLNGDGTVAVPPLRPDAPAGWYRHFATPGEVGPAVILGHVDTTGGPAVFYRLRDLRPGDTVTVRRRDGSTAVFTVDRLAQYPKSAFPTDAVYGAVEHPALRLVTCGGALDATRGEYRANLIVYATLTATAQR